MDSLRRALGLIIAFLIGGTIADILYQLAVIFFVGRDAPTPFDALIVFAGGVAAVWRTVLRRRAERHI